MDDENSPTLPWPFEAVAVVALLLVGGLIGMFCLVAARHILWRIDHGGRAGDVAILAVAGIPTWIMAKRISPSRAARWAVKAAIVATVIGGIAIIATDPPPSQIPMEEGDPG